MPIVCWGNLAKSADSTQRIEQSIQAYIEGHDENPNAHMGADYALGAHRLATELDHLEGSVSFYHLVMNQIVCMVAFESLDGWISQGSNYPGLLGALMSTDGASPVDKSWLYTDSKYSIGIDPAKNPFFQATVAMVDTTGYTGRVGFGAPGSGEGIGCFGFKLTNNKIYAEWWETDETQHTHELTGLAASGIHCYRAYHNTALDKTYFYVDGVLEYTLNGSLNPDGCGKIFEFYLERTTASQRYMYPIDFLFQQDR